MRFCTHCEEHNLLVKTANVKPTAMHKIFFTYILLMKKDHQLKQVTIIIQTFAIILFKSWENKVSLKKSISLKIIHTDRFFMFKLKLKKVRELIFGFNKVWQENFYKEHTTGLLYATVNIWLAWMSCTGNLRLVHVFLCGHRPLYLLQ